MKVIIESGATKSDWRVIEDDGRQIAEFKASGTNVSTMSLSVIGDIIMDSCRRIRSG